MSHPNAELLAAHIAALARGDLPAAMDFYTDDVVFHYPGRNRLSGDHAGKEAVVALLGMAFQLSEGTFKPEVHDIVASDDHVVALVTVHAERDGQRVSWDAIDVYHVRDGKLSEHWVHEADQDVVDRFWS